MTAQATQSSEKTFDWSHGGLELTLLIGLVLVMTGAVVVVVYHRYYAASERDGSGSEP